MRMRSANSAHYCHSLILFRLPGATLLPRLVNENHSILIRTSHQKLFVAFHRSLIICITAAFVCFQHSTTFVPAGCKPIRSRCDGYQYPRRDMTGRRLNPLSLRLSVRPFTFHAIIRPTEEVRDLAFATTNHRHHVTPQAMLVASIHLNNRLGKCALPCDVERR